MNPTISNISVDSDVYKFTLGGLNVSLANAIRRTILSDIPTTVFHTETYDDNQCIIQVNTSRLHNEIVKHRLSCIPIHIQELDLLPGKYVMELDMQNDTDAMVFATTEHFKIKNKENGNYLTSEETKRMFPPCPKTNMFIDFVRLRPKIDDNIKGERIKLSCEFSVHAANRNSMYNVVSKCSYGNTIDLVRANAAWDEHERKLLGEDTKKNDIELQKKNFYLLDAHRHYTEDSFDYCIQSVGVYENRDIVRKACIVLQNRLTDMIHAIDSDSIPVKYSETTMEHSHDIILENEDYTLGKVLEYILYEKYYISDQIMTFCGFKKFHPHDTDSTIRVAYSSPTDKGMLMQHLRVACVEAIDVFVRIGKLF